MRNIKNLGRAISYLAAAEAHEIALHEDVDAWSAPSECHGDVSRGEAKRRRLARKLAEAAAGAPLRVIENQARARARICVGSPCCPRWGSLVSCYHARFSIWGDKR